MKILLSAYACEPNKGSEPGVGWNWAVEVARLGHEVWVLTRSNNRRSIETELSKSIFREKLHFIYYDLPRWARRFKKIKGGIYPYYLAWQWGAYKAAKLVHQKVKFDLVHHVTFVSVRQPSFMGNLGIPFIFGPVAGGEKAPWRLRLHYGVRGIFIDAVRDFLNFIIKLDPLMRHTFKQAKKIYVTSEQTKSLLPTRFHQKTKLQLAIGIIDVQKMLIPSKKETPICSRILYVGRFLYWKGMGLGIHSFAQLAKKNTKATLTMVGEGPEEQRWRNLAKKLNIADRINWVPWVEKSKMSDIYKSHDVFLFPSLHDSGGMVVLEAMAHGLPVVCFDLGGPGIMVNNHSGAVVSTVGKNKNQVIEDLYSGLLKFTNNRSLVTELHHGAIRQAENFSWNQLITNIFEKLNN